MIVIEGLDGSGKATQAQFLYDRIKETRNNILKISFPNYEDNTSALVKMYLSGQMGKVNDVNAYAASTFFSVDRYATFQMYYKKQYQEGFIFVADRYTTSNMVHQAVKLPVNERDAYMQWLMDLEYHKMGLPTPDMVIYLDMEPEISCTLLEKRYNGNLGKRDIHESNLDYLLQCRETALLAAQKCGWTVVQCTNGQKPYTAYNISEKIWEIVSQIL